ncbi:hypothetical protein NMY22_g16910 [Coprinellus aureogranulatus]|nr:hypothetical protein NMY22_g16910 [Coprinellus aureogranulatus]
MALDCRKIADEVYALAKDPHDPLAPLVKEALEVIDHCLDTHRQDNVAISFNGGKDCTVLLHLYAGAIARRLPPSQSMAPIHALYIPVPSPFPTLEEFIADCVRTYNLDLFVCRPEDHTSSIESVVTPALVSREGSDYVGVNIANRPKAVGKSKGGEGMREALQRYKDRFPHISAILIVFTVTITAPIVSIFIAIIPTYKSFPPSASSFLEAITWQSTHRSSVSSFTLFRLALQQILHFCISFFGWLAAVNTIVASPPETSRWPTTAGDPFILPFLELYRVEGVRHKHRTPGIAS